MLATRGLAQKSFNRYKLGVILMKLAPGALPKISIFNHPVIKASNRAKATTQDNFRSSQWKL